MPDQLDDLFRRAVAERAATAPTPRPFEEVDAEQTPTMPISTWKQRNLLVAAVLGIVVAGIGVWAISRSDGSPEVVTDPTIITTSTTTPSVTESITTESTGTSEPTRTTESTEPPTATKPSISTNELAEGSGCTPPSGTDLPDGRWYGLVDEAGDGELVFDLACWFTGDAAVAASAEDGEESPPPNDYYTRNASDLLRTLDVEAAAPVTWYVDGGDPANVVTVPYDQWRTDRESRAFDLAVWLTIEGGIVVAIDEQWVP